MGGGPDFWDQLHAENESEISGGVYPLRSAPEREMLRILLERGQPGPGQDLVELGCGSSRYLPYAAQASGASIHGVDFSTRGLEQTRAALEAVGANPAGIVEATIEEFVEANPARFDVVASFGLIEHFDDLGEVLGWHVACARPGGRIVVTAPNFNHVNLGWTRRVAPGLFSWHRRVEPERVAELLSAAGVRDIRVEHIGGPRLFAYPEPEGRSRAQHLGALLARKALNGGGEAINRLAPAVARRLSGPRLAPFFAVSGTRVG